MQVLINIVLNGIEATPKGGSVTIESREISHESGRFCQIEVRDTGMGITTELQEAIFNPFFTTKEKGTGLGLAIAHRIVAEYGGFITVQSAEGRGSQFCINLPPIAAAQQADSQQSSRRSVG
jgi:signal transduction histidine kinase